MRSCDVKLIHMKTPCCLHFVAKLGIIDNILRRMLESPQTGTAGPYSPAIEEHDWCHPRDNYMYFAYSRGISLSDGDISQYMKARMARREKYLGELSRCLDRCIHAQIRRHTCASTSTAIYIHSTLSQTTRRRRRKHFD